MEDASGAARRHSGSSRTAAAASCQVAAGFRGDGRSWPAAAAAQERARGGGTALEGDGLRRAPELFAGHQQVFAGHREV